MNNDDNNKDLELNKETKEILNYYIDLNISPEYAILINAGWGNGKTHFIDNFIIEKKINKLKPISKNKKLEIINYIYKEEIEEKIEEKIKNELKYYYKIFFIKKRLEKKYKKEIEIEIEKEIEITNEDILKFKNENNFKKNKKCIFFENIKIFFQYKNNNIFIYFIKILNLFITGIIILIENFYYYLIEIPDYILKIPDYIKNIYNYIYTKTNCKVDDNIYIKISLFGIKTTEEIDEQIFIQLHPFLGSKLIKLATNILKSSLRLNEKIDLDSNGKDDINLNLDFKNLNLSKSNNFSKNIIYIFDDLERTNIDYNIILGYINNIVENFKNKVIIIANENEIENKDETINKNNYKIFIRFKEKVIGKTFLLNVDFDSAFNSFLKLTDTTTKLLKNNKEIIEKIFNESNHKNLRLIRQGILDFEFFYKSFNGDLDKYFLIENNESDELKKDFIKDFIEIYFTLSMEFKNGNHYKNITNDHNKILKIFNDIINYKDSNKDSIEDSIYHDVINETCFFIEDKSKEMIDKIYKIDDYYHIFDINDINDIINKTFENLDKESYFNGEILKQLINNVLKSNMKDYIKSSITKKILFKYLNKDNNIINNIKWYDLLVNNKYKKEDIIKVINNSKYFLNTEDWIKLYHFYNLEINELKKILKNVLKDFKNNKFKEPQIILHISGILLKLIKYKLIDDKIINKDKIVKIAKNNIENNIDILSENSFNDYLDFDLNGGYLGLGYCSENDETFKKIKNNILKIYNNKVKNKNLENIRNNFLNMLNEGDKIDIKEIKKELENENKGFLKDIDINDLLLKIFKLKNKYIYDIIESLYRRFKIKQKNKVNNLYDEIKFWEDFNKKIKIIQKLIDNDKIKKLIDNDEDKIKELVKLLKENGIKKSLFDILTSNIK